MNKEHSGLIIHFWRTFYPEKINYVEWLTWMEKRDDKPRASSKLNETTNVDGLDDKKSGSEQVDICPTNDNGVISTGYKVTLNEDCTRESTQEQGSILEVHCVQGDITQTKYNDLAEQLTAIRNKYVGK